MHEILLLMNCLRLQPEVVGASVGLSQKIKSDLFRGALAKAVRIGNFFDFGSSRLRRSKPPAEAAGNS